MKDLVRRKQDVIEKSKDWSWQQKFLKLLNDPQKIICDADLGLTL